MEFKGILLAGGFGTRLRPLTSSVNKHLLPIYDKPLIFYSLSILMLANIKDIIIVTNKSSLPLFKSLLGDGKKFGIKLRYIVQKKPDGIPNALILAEKFVKNSNVALVLGDNFFYGQGFTEILNKPKINFSGAEIFCFHVKNPSQFGIAKIKKNKIILLKEKPKKFISSLAISGIYFLDHKAITIAKKLKKSKRKETEIIDLLEIYRQEKKLKYSIIGRGATWLDTGTCENLFNANNFVYNVEQRQGYKIACLEEISFKKKWISKKDLLKISSKYKGTSYGQYLKNLI